jgi:hypothetical protein
MQLITNGWRTKNSIHGGDAMSVPKSQAQAKPRLPAMRPHRARARHRPLNRLLPHTVQVIAVLHTSRDPLVWQSRSH